MSVRVTLSKEGYSTYFMAIQSRLTFWVKMVHLGRVPLRVKNQNSARAKTNISLALLQLAISV